MVDSCISRYYSHAAATGFASAVRRPKQTRSIQGLGWSKTAAVAFFTCMNPCMSKCDDVLHSNPNRKRTYQSVRELGLFQSHNACRAVPCRLKWEIVLIQSDSESI